jgi:hypothetical protein
MGNFGPRSCSSPKDGFNHVPGSTSACVITLNDEPILVESERFCLKLNLGQRLGLCSANHRDASQQAHLLPLWEVSGSIIAIWMISQILHSPRLLFRRKG